ncbi:putative bifunctional diguanylate cyclase/phosphodiesterase [Gallaecimonas mangrovi]|uniref:putative bifunctional diguanylate cyclase/phosphodiesterase n=1 Tax=Gallaecimonas mangrovi TaxID=2291597 RepID=UPI001868491A|nr:EAL domain-containing protein [Gallaecimonas mangrovi]
MHWQRGTLTYLAALSIIALLSLFSHFLVQSIVERQEATARTVNLAGRQRMLSQRITLFAGELLNKKGDAANNSELDEQYMDAVNTMAQVHSALKNGSTALNIPKPKSEQVNNIFEFEPVNLDARVKHFLEVAHAVDNGSLGMAARTRAYLELQTMASRQILQALDTLVLQYQQDSEAAIGRLIVFNRISLAAMFITLLLEGLFIFRPLLLNLYRRERQYHGLLKKMDREISEQVHLQTFHNLLTQLPNRLSMLEKIEAFIQAANQQQSHFVVISIGLDRFKDVNNSLGYEKGDTLLMTLAERLKTIGDKYNGVVGHITGDEFVILLPHRRNNVELMRVIRKLSKSINAPFNAEQYAIQVTASLGLASYPEDGIEANTLLLHANQALRSAKDEGGNAFRFFQPAMTEQMLRRIEVEQQLRRAMSDRSQLQLYYQPKVNLQTGAINGVEALVRWQHPSEGLLQPAEFIAIAEDSNLILELGDWVLVHALDQLATWNNQGLDIEMAINISAKQLMRRNICDRIAALARQKGLKPARIELEITESHLMENRASIMEQLKDLERYGFSLAIDDFGTGHSSLARLRDLPVHTLKIDKSFVGNALLDKRDTQLIQAIINMGHSMGKNIVAEGIETDEQANLLKLQGCDEGQGYLFTKPVPADNLTPMLKRNQMLFEGQKNLARFKD